LVGIPLPELDGELVGEPVEELVRSMPLPLPDGELPERLVADMPVLDPLLPMGEPLFMTAVPAPRSDQDI
jgi:hypothetical protein